MTARFCISILIGSLAVACSRPAALPDLILMTLDTVRADRVGAYGYRRPTTPRLDRFAQGAVLCERAYTSVPITLPLRTACAATGSTGCRIRQPLWRSCCEAAVITPSR